MNTTNEEEFYEDSLMQCGHISSEICQLLTRLGQFEANPSVVDFVKTNMLRHDQEVIKTLAIAEQAVLEFRKMVERWAAIATARLQ